MPSHIVEYLDAAIRAAGVPLLGVSVTNEADRQTWVPRYDPSATAADRAAGDAIVAAFDPATIPAAAADADAANQTQVKLARALVAYVWRATHAGVNPTGAQLVGEVATLKAIYKALP